jgi:hypothetical protein
MTTYYYKIDFLKFVIVAKYKSIIQLNAVTLNQVSVKAVQLFHLSLSTDQETLESGTCGQRD